MCVCMRVTSLLAHMRASTCVSSVHTSFDVDITVCVLFPVCALCTCVCVRVLLLSSKMLSYHF